MITTAHDLLTEALDEDAREGGRFDDADGFSNFFPEEGRDDAMVKGDGK